MTPTVRPRLVLFARYPVAGMAKTRLIPAIGADGAADVHRCLTERTIATLTGHNAIVELRYTGGTREEFTTWLGDEISFEPQVEGDLTDRLLDALDPAPVIFFGADTPDLGRHHVAAAIEALENAEVVIGPASDGGYYLIGVSGRHDYLFRDMRWSTEHVLPDTLARLSERGIEPVMLETLSDCDRPEDLVRWPWLAR